MDVSIQLIGEAAYLQSIYARIVQNKKQTIVTMVDYAIKNRCGCKFG